jgi:hypothetical protein
MIHDQRETIFERELEAALARAERDAAMELEVKAMTAQMNHADILAVGLDALRLSKENVDG